MGLDFHTEGYEGESAHWSYSGFNDFRKKLAAEAGIDLGEMQGYCGFDRWKVMEEGGEEGYLKALKEDGEKEKRSWDEIDDDLKSLLHHSDCDGDMSPHDCAKVASRIRELVASWDDKHPTQDIPEEWQKAGYPAQMTFNNHDKVGALLLAAEMEYAAQTNQKLVFC